MRVLSHPLNGWVDPAVAFVALYGETSQAVWLDSGVHASSGMSVMGAAARVLTASVGDATVTVDGKTWPGNVFEALRADLQANAVHGAHGFPLGWVGWLGYELGAQTMATEPTQTSRYPDTAFAFLDRAVSFDHATGAVTLLALGDSWSPELCEWRSEVEQLLRDGAALSEAEPAGGCVSAHNSAEPSPINVRWPYSEEQYLAMIRSAQASITAGEAYLICLTTEARVSVTPQPLATYLALRKSSPSHHGSYLRMGEITVLSASPEQFIAVSASGQVVTKPIKGTRRRGATAQEDAALRNELLTSDKERAENLMIVDLMRNDIGRIARGGSVGVSDLLTVESYAQVHQLVSTVCGELADGLSGVDAVMSCFPAGSMTGTPKSSATRIIDQLEHRPRGIYSGAIGYFGLDGSVDLAMVIRSIVLDPEGATIGTGGGITALSVPEEELDEVYLKASTLLRALGVDDGREFR